MFAIEPNTFQTSNPDRGMEQTGQMPPVTDSDATQRVNVGTGTIYPPQRRSAPKTTANRQQPKTGKRKNPNSNSKERILIFVLLGVALILLVGVIIAARILMRNPADDGLIQSNVFAAGVNLGGMSEDDAKKALTEATKDTYTKLDMTVQVLENTIFLPPEKTGAKLDVDKVVAEALSRDSAGTISVRDYLSLDTDYIRSVVDELGNQYSSVLTQGKVTLEGNKPTEPMDKYDTNTAYQTLVIYVGTPEYGLNTDALYDQILDAYDINLFQVVAQCSVVAPDPLNLETYYNDVYFPPKDATLDTETYEVTKEVYGYGFDLTKANEAIASAQYGQTITIPIYFIQPDITAEMLTADLFRDELAEFSTGIMVGNQDSEDNTADANLRKNLQLACKAIHNQIIKAGESFSFFEHIKPSHGQNYTDVEIFVGTELKMVTGGGISQVATTLYNCALLSDLTIVERHTHAYAPGYVSPGLDAMVQWGSADLIFTNTTDYPIRIEAEIIEDRVVVRLIGTDNNDYYVAIDTEVVEHRPITLHQTMVQDKGYSEGDVLVEGIVGYDVIVYRNLHEKETNRELSSSVLTYGSYDKRNEVVVSIFVPSVDPEDPTEPVDPSEPSTEPSTEPSAATE